MIFVISICSNTTLFVLQETQSCVIMVFQVAACTLIIQTTLSRPISFNLDRSRNIQFNFAFFHSFQNILRHVSYYRCVRSERAPSVLPGREMCDGQN